MSNDDPTEHSEHSPEPSRPSWARRLLNAQPRTSELLTRASAVLEARRMVQETLAESVAITETVNERRQDLFKDSKMLSDEALCKSLAGGFNRTFNDFWCESVDLRTKDPVRQIRSWIDLYASGIRREPQIFLSHIHRRELTEIASSYLETALSAPIRRR